jgi:hypothetical protein
MVISDPPLPPAAMAAPAQRRVRNTPSRLTAVVYRQSARLVALIGWTRATPALATAMSRPPNSATILSTVACISLSLVTSHRIAWPRSNEAADACAPLALISVRTVVAASSCKALAMAYPIPRLAP